MNVQGKIWGETSLLFNKNNVEFHRIVGKKGGYSSKHKHVSKYNMFFIEKGILRVKVWKEKEYNLIDETTLYKGDTTVVPPGYFHLFEVIQDDTVAYEIYWIEISSMDIIRENVGGMNQ